jgi:hypothetical protein
VYHVAVPVGAGAFRCRNPSNSAAFRPAMLVP